MNDSIKSVTIKKNIHCPASYYFCSGFVPELAKEILQIINNYEKNSIYIKSIDMNNNTYNWLFRLFTNPIENPINPLSSTADKKYEFVIIPVLIFLVFISPSNKFGWAKICLERLHSISDGKILFFCSSICGEYFPVVSCPKREFSFGGNKSSVNCSSSLGDS